MRVAVIYQRLYASAFQVSGDVAHLRAHATRWYLRVGDQLRQRCRVVVVVGGGGVGRVRVQPLIVIGCVTVCMARGSFVFNGFVVNIFY